MALFWATAALAALLVSVSAGRADAIDSGVSAVVAVEAIGKDGVLTLTDGSKICIPGIWVPAIAGMEYQKDPWRSAWRGIIEDGAFLHRVERRQYYDRYGCLNAHVETADGVALSHALLEAGWAAVDPASMQDDARDINAMLVLEDRARQARRGIWRRANAMPKKADQLSDWIGTRQLVEDRVQRVSGNDRYVYLNFGADWRTDFTVRLDRRTIDAIGFDPADLEGKKLRVRGVLQESRGPLIDVSSLKQIELLP